jgi:hypothetical protein
MENKLFAHIFIFVIIISLTSSTTQTTNTVGTSVTVTQSTTVPITATPTSNTVGTTNTQTTNTVGTSVTVTASTSVPVSSQTETFTVGTTYSTTGAGENCKIDLIPEVVFARANVSANMTVFIIDIRIFNNQDVSLNNVLISVGPISTILDSLNLNVTANGSFYFHLSFSNWLTECGGIHPGKVFHGGLTIETEYGVPTFDLAGYSK